MAIGTPGQADIPDRSDSQLTGHETDGEVVMGLTAVGRAAGEIADFIMGVPTDTATVEASPAEQPYVEDGPIEQVPA